MENSSCCNPVAGHQIATNFCTCHSTAVVPCTKFCSNHCIRFVLREKRNFQRIWIAMKKTLVKWGPAVSFQVGRRGKCSRHSRRMRNPQFYVYGKRPIDRFFFIIIQLWVTVNSNDNRKFIYDIFHNSTMDIHCVADNIKCDLLKWIWKWTWEL